MGQECASRSEFLAEGRLTYLFDIFGIYALRDCCEWWRMKAEVFVSQKWNAEVRSYGYYRSKVSPKDEGEDIRPAGVPAVWCMLC